MPNTIDLIPSKYFIFISPDLKMFELVKRLLNIYIYIKIVCEIGSARVKAFQSFCIYFNVMGAFNEIRDNDFTGGHKKLKI